MYSTPQVLIQTLVGMFLQTASALISCWQKLLATRFLCQQVTPTHKGADWITARAWPACACIDAFNGRKILCMGGDTADGDSVASSSSLLFLHLAAAPSSHRLQAASSKNLLERLKKNSGEALSIP